MPNTPNASFIPKQGPVRRERQTASRQVHIFNVISYLLFTATLVASAGVFLFNRHLETALAAEVSNLSTVIAGFNEADMLAVQEFNLRLQQARQRIDNSISIVSIFDALETATVQAVELTQLSIKREADTSVLVVAKVDTDSFDSSLFQRGVYERSQVISDVEITDLSLNGAAEGEAEATQSDGVSFMARISVPSSAIPYTPVALFESVATTTQPEAATTTDSSSAVETDSSEVTNI